MNQRSKTLVQLVVMLVIAGVLGAFAWFNVYKKDEHEEKVKAHDEVLFAVHQVEERQADGGAPEAEFTSVKVFSNGETTTLERELGGVWKMTAPTRASVDKLVVDQLLTQLQTAKFRTKLEESPTAEQLESWGLKTPAFTVEARAQLNGTDRTVSLRGGIDNSFDGTVYMQRGDDKAVYLAAGGVRWALARSSFDLRQKEVLPFDESAVATFSVKSKVNIWQLNRNQIGQWVLETPANVLVDAATIAGMLGTLRQERASAFFDDTAANRTAYGLDAPLVEGAVTLKDGTQHTIRLGVVRSDAGADQFFALVTSPSGTLIGQVSAGLRGALDRNANDLRDHSVLVFDKNQLSKIVVERDGARFTLDKETPDASADGWRVTTPEPHPAKVFKVSALIYAVAGIKYATVVDEAPKDLAKYGLGPGARFISFSSPSAELTRLTVGKPVPGQDKMFYVKGAGPQVYQTDGSRFDELPWALSDVTDLPPADAGH